MVITVTRDHILNWIGHHTSPANNVLTYSVFCTVSPGITLTRPRAGSTAARRRPFPPPTAFSTQVIVFKDAALNIPHHVAVISQISSHVINLSIFKNYHVFTYYWRSAPDQPTFAFPTETISQPPLGIHTFPTEMSPCPSDLSVEAEKKMVW